MEWISFQKPMAFAIKLMEQKFGFLENEVKFYKLSSMKTVALLYLPTPHVKVDSTTNSAQLIPLTVTSSFKGSELSSSSKVSMYCWNLK